jgi:hypothetical protein
MIDNANKSNLFIFVKKKNYESNGSDRDQANGDARAA